MILQFALSLLPPCLLLVTFLYLWRERVQFSTLSYIVAGIAVLGFSRLLDVVLENNALLFSSGIDTNRVIEIGRLEMVGDIADSLGVLLLVYGFVRTIRFQRSETRLIESLETLLPICSTCKKIRKPDNSWEPIEQYLVETGAPQLTHSICPECKEVYLAALKKGKR